MFRRCIALLLSVLILPLCCLSCSSRESDTVAHTFERSFSAVLTVNNGKSEYRAQVTLSAITDPVAGGSDTASPRDGRVQYLSPDSISDIYAERTDAKVKVGLSGIEITPSPEISEKYVRLLDMLDIRSDQLTSFSKTEIDGREVCEAVFSSSAVEVKVLFDRETLVPISLTSDEIQMQFNEFVYL